MASRPLPLTATTGRPEATDLTSYVSCHSWKPWTELRRVALVLVEHVLLVLAVLPAALLRVGLSGSSMVTVTSWVRDPNAPRLSSPGRFRSARNATPSALASPDGRQLRHP